MRFAVQRELYHPAWAIRRGHGLLNWTNGLDHSMAEKAVPVERDDRTRTAKYLLLVTSKIAAAVGITR
ncbi:MAG: hypothetical protein ACLPUG_02590 [Acidimicrobiales bacterium]